MIWVRKSVQVVHVSSLWFIILHHKCLFDSCYSYCVTHVHNSVSNDMVILIIFWFLLWYTFIINRSMSAKKYTTAKIDKKLMRNIVHKLYLVSDLKKEIMKEVNPIQDGLFQACSRMEGAEKGPLPKICHTYPILMKLGTVTPYLKNIQKIYESCDTPWEFWHQHFFTEN